ncbi:hypothetical protein COCON_G00218700 [Conger conger]|uniref:Uncharacterized protein n=1 Tax=Conger conger TaxID=82655 RepID=A0A9Q1HPM7_CONCO|nr:hypothetical protein COCON_G00218700 [Conger conger]
MLGHGNITSREATGGSGGTEGRDEHKETEPKSPPVRQGSEENPPLSTQCPNARPELQPNNHGAPERESAGTEKRQVQSWRRLVRVINHISGPLHPSVP